MMLVLFSKEKIFGDLTNGSVVTKETIEYLQSTIAGCAAITLEIVINIALTNHIVEKKYKFVYNTVSYFTLTFGLIHRIVGLDMIG